MVPEKTLFLLACGAVVPSILHFHLSERLYERILPPQCNWILDGEFFMDPAIIYPHLECMGAVGRAMYLEFYVYDWFFFPFVYAVVLQGALRRLWPHAGTAVVMALPVVAAMADVCENTGMRYLLQAFPRRHEAIESAISICMRTKYAFFFAALGLVLLGLLRWPFSTATPYYKAKSKAN